MVAKRPPAPSAAAKEGANKRHRSQKERRDMEAKVQRLMEQHVMPYLPKSVIETEKVDDMMISAAVEKKITEVGPNGRISAGFWQERSAKYGKRTSLLSHTTSQDETLQVRDELHEVLGIMMHEDNKIRSNESFHAFLSYCSPLNVKEPRSNMFKDTVIATFKIFEGRVAETSLGGSCQPALGTF